MKIFWSRAVGRNEHGHSTIFLGTENRAGWPVRSLLGEQCSLWLWGEECAAKQNRLRALLATRNARAIWSESLARLSLTHIWPHYSEVAPAFPRQARNADCNCL